MRITVDIPEDLLRLAKAAAVRRGEPLDGLVVAALRAALGGEPTPANASERGDTSGGKRQDLVHGCVLPLIEGEGGPALRGLMPRRPQEILDEEDVARAARRP